MPLPLFDLSRLRPAPLAPRAPRASCAGTRARHVGRLSPARPRRRRQRRRPCWCRSSIGPRACAVLLTQRSADLPDHPGQISFPGRPRRARRRAMSRPPRCARPTEEIGLPRDRVAVLGRARRLRDGHRLSRHAGRRLGRAAVRVHPDPVEVADVFEVPLAFLLDPDNQLRHFRMLGDIAPRLLAIPYRRALHLGRDGGDADDPRPHACAP